MKRLTVSALAALAHPVWAHGGQGQATEMHWHVSDVWGLALVAACAAVALWLSRPDR